MQVRTFSVDPSIIYSLITAQAGTLGKALLECIMNSVDAGATEVDIRINQSSLRVTDNGRGFASIEDIEKYFEVFGFQHEGDQLQSDRVYGQFGIGRAQLWSFASTVWRTDRFRMEVDIKNSGLEYGRWDDCEVVQGVCIEGTFYEQLSYFDLNATERELAELAKYVPVPVSVNGHRVSTDMGKENWTHETEDAWIRIKESGDFSVYNLGVLVRRYPAYHFGCGGEVVTRPGVRLELNMARNDVLVSKCKVWKRIRPYIQKQADKFICRNRATAGELEAAKQNQVLRALSGEYSFDEMRVFLYGAKLITDVRGRHITIATAANHISYAWAAARSRKEPRAVKFAEQSQCMVLSPETLARFGVEDMAGLREALMKILSFAASLPYRRQIQIESIRFHESLEEAGCVLNEDYQVVPESNCTEKELAVLHALNYLERSVRRSIAHCDGSNVVIHARDILVGASSVAQAWTDGRCFIAIERKQLKLASSGLPGFLKLAGILVHEYLHNVTSAGSHVHDEDFYRQFHDAMLNDDIGYIVRLAFRKYVSRCRKKGIKLEQAVLKDLDLFSWSSDDTEGPEIQDED